MKSAIVWLAFVIVVVLVRVTEAQLTCYECLHTETKETIEGYESTCAEPFVPDGVETCTGYACIIMWHDFGSMGELECLVENHDKLVDYVFSAC